MKGEVIASTLNHPTEEHTHVRELAIERAKRLVENGEDVVIILDGITRLDHAYDTPAPASGRILSGGIDAGATSTRRRSSSVRPGNLEEGGSLTILATALVETDSNMDDAIFEEFKGTGNMELASTASWPTTHLPGDRRRCVRPAPATRSCCSTASSCRWLLETASRAPAASPRTATPPPAWNCWSIV